LSLEAGPRVAIILVLDILIKYLLGVVFCQ
jgi:hypothetical protein